MKYFRLGDLPGEGGTFSLQSDREWLQCEVKPYVCVCGVPFPEHRDRVFDLLVSAACRLSAKEREWMSRSGCFSMVSGSPVTLVRRELVDALGLRKKGFLVGSVSGPESVYAEFSAVRAPERLWVRTQGVAVGDAKTCRGCTRPLQEMAFGSQWMESRDVTQLEVFGLSGGKRIVIREDVVAEIPREMRKGIDLSVELPVR